MINDLVDDALDVLDKSNANYLLIIPFGRRTIIHSNLGSENTKMMIKAINEGWMSENIISHLEMILDKEDDE